MQKSKKKSGRKTLINKLDRIFNKYIRLRDGQCVVCGSTEYLQCGHLLSKKSYATRWSEKNANCQCGGCNREHNYNSAPYTLWFINTYGKKELHKLTKEYYGQKKYSNEDLKNLIEIYKKKVEKYEISMDQEKIND